jgi:hypothetical protein
VHYALAAPEQVDTLDDAIAMYRAAVELPFAKDVTVLVWGNNPDISDYPDFIIEAGVDGEPKLIRT